MWNAVKKAFRGLALGAAVAIPSFAGACLPTEGTVVDLHGQKVRLTLIHTSDIHSRLFPYQYTPLVPDKAAGMQDGKGPYGGMARMAYVIKRERARADRSIHIDGGDIFQGAPIFNYFSGEAETRALAETGVDAMVIANHEFDRGVINVMTQFQKWASFPVLAANYITDNPELPGAGPAGTILKPYTVLNVRGLRVGVIGMGNLSTITSIFEQPNRLGILPYKTSDVAQFYIDLLRPQVDLVVAVTHLGLDVDEQMIKDTEGLDIVLGGHNHIVVSPPKQVFDCGGVDQADGFVDVPAADGATQHRACKPRRVLLMHSGAFAKFVGRLDVDVTDVPAAVNETYNKRDVYDPVNAFEVVSHDMQIFPIDNSVPEDRDMTSLLEPYKQALTDVGNLDLLVGYAPADVKRTAPNGGDSQLGNLIATSMWLRLGVQTDFSMTNTTGIRADLPKGPITIEQMFNVFPFDNSITKMQVSGSEILEMFDFTARRSQLRGCVSQVQVAGMFMVMDCAACHTFYRPDRRPLDASPTDIDVQLPEACAEQIFIGYTDQTCTKDTDCLGATGSCVSNGSKKVCGGTSTVCNADADCVALSRFACDRTIGRCLNPIARTSSYELATSNYLAGGGSGFSVLKRNTTQFDTKIQQRDAATDFVRIGRPCGWQQPPGGGPGGLAVCSSDKDCAPLGDFVCACPEASSVVSGPDDAQIACATKPTQSCGGGGRCVLKSCRDDVASFHDDEDCKGSSGDAKARCRVGACSQSGEQCKILACLDASLGAVVDGRQVLLGR
ncbi:MAG: bifunctional metallophosphatase/5'-nucleotidase [Polyangiales bacterium]